MAYEAWTGECAIAPNPPNCPAVPGPDYDFGQGPILASGGSAKAGPAVVGNRVYCGSGYTFLDFGVANNRLFAFEIRQKAESCPLPRAMP